MPSDLKFAFRQLLKNPGFTAVAVLTLALGIGANTALFSVVNAVLLRPLPFKDPEQLVWVDEVSNGGRQEAWGGHFLDWQKQSQTLDGIAAYDNSTWTLTGAGEAERVEVGNISSGFLPLLGVQPQVPGRNFTSDEDKPGGNRVAILSHVLWQRRFEGRPDVVGGSITLNDASYTVIGVLPATFRFVHPFDVWVPLGLDPQRELAGDSRYYGPTIARLKPGVSLGQAQAELDTLLQRYESTRPQGQSRIDSRVQLVPLRTYLVGDTGRPLLVLLGAVGLVLMMACANVANLLLARAVARRKELAVRAALGASRARLTRQLLTECLVLAACGGAGGFLLALWLTELFGAVRVSDVLGRMGELTAITMDQRVFGFTLLVTLLTGLTFGLVPALRFSSHNLNASLREGAGGSKAQGRGLRGALMVSEVALAMVLLTGAGLLIHSFVRLLQVNPGYRAEHLLTARLQLPPRYSERVKRAQFYEQLLERIAALPGIVSAGATSHLPLVRYNLGAMVSVEGRSPVDVPISTVDPGYFQTMGISLRSGRLLNDGDAQGSPSVAILSETLARRLFPNEEALGKRFVLPGSDAPQTTVVGIVSDVRHGGLDREIENALYLSYRQVPRPGMALVLRSEANAVSIASTLRQALREIDPSLPLYDVMTMDTRLSNSVAGRRFNLILLVTFATVALLLAGVGVYGVIAYLVTERTREVGIRMALGAARGDVVALILRRGLTLGGTGIALGILAALGLTRLLTTLLFEVKPADPLAFAGGALTLLLVALLASWLPARRAANIDPVEALRHD